ncbi:MAG TPA: Flp pilus assembly protein CpaB [Gaiellaceae bacterium]
MSSKLFTTRQGTILLGVIAAVIAAVALIVYLNHYRNSVNKPPVNVLVAQKLIQKNTPGDVIRTAAGYYKVTSIPQKQVETGAIVDPASLAGKVALTDISGGQQLTAADFGTGGGVAGALQQTQRAVVVSLGSPAEVGGQIAGGSHVDVYVSSTAQSSSGVTRPTVKLLFQDMYVLNAGTNGGNVTLRATPTQAGQLIFASQNATIWLTLRPTIGSITKKAPVITARNVTGG